MSNYAKTQQWIAFALTPNADMSTLTDEQLDDLADCLATIPRFKAADPQNDKTVCLAAWCQKDKFEEDTDAVALYLYDKEQQCGDWWTGSLSDKIIKGNEATTAASTWWQITLNNLAAIGYQYGNDLSQLHTLVGKTIPCCIAEVTSKKSQKTYFVVKYIGQGRGRAKRVKVGVIGAAKAPAFGAPGAFAPAPAPAPAAAPVAASVAAPVAAPPAAPVAAPPAPAAPGDANPFL